MKWNFILIVYITNFKKIFVKIFNKKLKKDGAVKAPINS